MERVMLTPLTPEEQQFAADNYECLQHCIRAQRLDQDMTDVAALGYVHAVKKWFARPDLHKWPFRSIAYQTIRCHVSNERCKQGRRIQAVSLDAEVPGTDGFTLGATITYDNLSYLKEDHMNVSYNVKLPDHKASGVKSDETIAIEGFLVGKMRNMCFEYETVDEARRKQGCIYTYRRTKKHQEIYEMFRIENKIYIVRLEQKAGAKR
ncbi:hypothetical protein [Enterocloster citroniae]|uniref:hypothetical protein n=1 Tax=Enterocloster citroniae TaxID=358743 RepID=UPI00349E857D